MTCTITELIADALAKAKASKASNMIGVRMRDATRREVTLTTIIQGQPLAWIAYDAEQLDELIRLLQAYRADMTVGQR
ncbi:hypothetical protein [Bradyrhizobium sp. SZCCHNPS1003]|uniref:hypothetical protein n=1 Tax=Bradyrhizobium sp. SZCCHNPS1003 TaxID=3057330 RepID=UPI0028EE024A|nr:hypothetical protein [Bradyrhizobium sp. SZCCHNPS1003]